MKVIRPLLLVLLYVGLPMVMMAHLWGNPVSAGEDDLVYYLPLRKMTAAALSQGQLPLYNPREATGTPLLADPQSAVLHPTTWLFVALWPNWKLAYSLSLFAGFSLAGGGAYLYLRRLGLVRTAAVFGSVAFMFCGFLVGHRVHLSLVITAAMLPWGLWCIESLRLAATARDRVRAALGFTPVLFFSLAAGHWPTVIHMALIWGAYFLLRARPLLKSLAVLAPAAALAAALAWPQLQMTLALMADANRSRIGLAMAGENSFLPTSAVLAFFPFFMGSRTPNFFPQTWWGSWHLCEMLGYVGLVTLVLAAACVWRLYRRPASASTTSPEESAVVKLVRHWTWLALGAAVFMLGYYLPTYALIHKLPVLGVVRCPARMMLAVEMALATLAAVALHVLLSGGVPDNRWRRLRRSTFRVALLVLPAAMLACVGFWKLVGLALANIWPDRFPGLPFAGGANAVQTAASFASPAVYVPFMLMFATAAMIVVWLRQPLQIDAATPANSSPAAAAPPARACPIGAAFLVVLLLVDLFTITGFVDVPAQPVVAQDGSISPAAAYLRSIDPDTDSYRIWGMSPKYHSRPAELLLPKTCEALGFSTIGSYGPFESPAHPQLFGFRIWGYTRDWPALLRRNHLLSLYGVKYILAAEPEYRQLIESVRVGDAAAPDGPNLLGDKWELSRAAVNDGVVRLRAPLMFLSSQARQRVQVEPDKVYRIALDARGPKGGAALFLRAELVMEYSGRLEEHDELGLTAEAEEIGSDWRHFEWRLQTYPADYPAPNRICFRLYSIGERPLEVRNASLTASRWEQPTNFGGKLKPGQPVYKKLAELPALDAGGPPVAIYQNLLCQPIAAHPVKTSSAAAVDALKYLPEGQAAVPIDFALPAGPNPVPALRRVTLPAAVAYLLCALLAACWPSRSRRD